MISTGDRLICTVGNDFYTKGNEYVVGEFINHKYFELFTGINNECWYATIDDSGIYISFDATSKQEAVAWFNIVKDKSDGWLDIYKTASNV